MGNTFADKIKLNRVEETKPLQERIILKRLELNVMVEAYDLQKKKIKEYQESTDYRIMTTNVKMKNDYVQGMVKELKKLKEEITINWKRILNCEVD